MSDKTEDYNLILKNMQEELKEQRILLNTVIKEIGVIKELLTLSSRMAPTFTPNTTLLNQNPTLFSPSDSLDNRAGKQAIPASSPSSQPRALFSGNTEILAYLQGLKENLSEPTKNTLIDQWKQAREAYKLIIQSKNDEEQIHLPLYAKEFVKQVLLLMHQVFKPTMTVDSTSIEDISHFMRDLGPLPIMLNYDLVAFVNTVSTTPAKKIGKKTSEQLYKYLEELYVSVSDLLEIIMN